MAHTEFPSTTEWSCYNSCYWIPVADSPEEVFRKRMAHRAEALAMIAEITQVFRPLMKAIQVARRMFERRSAPRWGAARWKAKT